jgi:hypothetical protein
VITGFDGHRIVCGWDDCDRDGLELYKTLEHRHPVGTPCGAWDRQVSGATDHTAHSWQVFCSHRHQLYWGNATGANAQRSITSTGRAYGNLPVGSRGTIL